jgi:hypothetical protein
MPRARERQKRNEVNIQSVEHGVTGTFGTIHKYRNENKEVSVDGSNLIVVDREPFLTSTVMNTDRSPWMDTIDSRGQGTILNEYRDEHRQISVDEYKRVVDCCNSVSTSLQH